MLTRDSYGIFENTKKFYSFLIVFLNKFISGSALPDINLCSTNIEYECSENQIINRSNYLACKVKNKHLLSTFEHLVVYS
jgi:hypothetical protein